MNALYRTLTKFILEKLVIGLEEPILIKDIGKLTAKVDSGNSGYNVIHGTDFVRQGNVLIFKTCDENGNEKRVSKPIDSTININIGGGNVQERPVILLDVSFAGENYQSVPFSVTDRSSNDEKVLLCKDFVKDQLSALIDVNGKNLTNDGNRVEYEELKEGWFSNFNNTLYDYSKSDGSLHSLKQAWQDNHSAKTADEKLAAKIKKIKSFLQLDLENIKQQITDKQNGLLNWSEKNQNQYEENDILSKVVSFVKNFSVTSTSFFKAVKVIDYIGGTQQASALQNKQYFNGTYGVMSGLNNTNGMNSTSDSKTTTKKLGDSKKLSKTNSIFSKYLKEGLAEDIKNATENQNGQNQNQKLDALNKKADQLLAQERLIENSNYFILYYVPFQNKANVNKTCKTYSKDLEANKIACTTMFSVIGQNKDSQESCVIVAQKIKEYIDSNKTYSLEHKTKVDIEKNEVTSETKPPFGFFFYCFGDETSRKATMLPIYTSVTIKSDEELNEEMGKSILPDEEIDETKTESTQQANEFLKTLFQIDENIDYSTYSDSDIADFFSTVEDVEQKMKPRFENLAKQESIKIAQNTPGLTLDLQYDIALKSPSIEFNETVLKSLETSGLTSKKNQERIETLKQNIEELKNLSK